MTLPDSLASILDPLNPAQRQAATAGDEPLLVLAGAGSGKTRVIVHRIAYLLAARGVPPEAIVALTFTNKAAGEMRRRVDALLGARAEGLWVLTFHALGLRLLRRYGEEVGLPPGFTLLDEEDRRAYLRRILRALDVAEREWPVRRVAALVSARKAAPFGAGEASIRPRDRELVERVAERYARELAAAGAVDFDDLLLKSVELLEGSERARRFVEGRCRYVLVDEYQDTNRVQYRLLRLLAPHGRLFVVGDDDQSIYHFRGADLRNILDFEADFPDARVVKLERNYRSAGAILEAANALIAHNRRRKGKRLVPSREPGEPPLVYAAPTDRDEAAFVARRIDEARREHPAERIAVLVRTHAQTRLFEEELVARGVPHVLVGGQRFYERREIKDVLAYLRLARNPADDASFVRVVNVPARGVGPATVALVEHAARAASVPLWEAAGRLVDAGAAGLTARGHRGLAAFRETVASLGELAAVRSPAEMVREVIDRTGLLAAYRAESPAEAEARRENVLELVRAAEELEEQDPKADLDAFLDRVGLLTDVDRMSEHAPCVLMTLHSAKGLEFDVVFLTGLEEGLFPHVRAVGDERAVEEERRLCYVGMTRARRRLVLSYAQARRATLQREGRSPSRFLLEIPPELLRAAEGDGPRPPAWDSLPPGRFRAGTTVRHPRFGRGVVETVDGHGAEVKLTVRFRSVGRKKILPAYARLEVVDAGS